MKLGDVYCFWDSQTLVDTCLMIFNTCVAGVLLFLVIRTYLKAKIVLIGGVLKFYYLMMCWGVRIFMFIFSVYRERYLQYCGFFQRLLGTIRSSYPQPINENQNH